MRSLLYARRVISNDNELVCIGAKVVKKRLKDISLNERGSEETIEHKDKYWLIVVKGAPNNQKTYLMRDLMEKTLKRRFIGIRLLFQYHFPLQTC